MTRSLDRSVYRVSSVHHGVPSADPSTILDRQSRSSGNHTNLSPIQLSADQLVGDFWNHASDWQSLASMTVGSLASRWGKMAVLSQGGAIHKLPLRVLAIGVGLGAEVTAFEFTNRVLISVQGSRSKVSGRPETLDLAPETNLWSWSGPGSLKEGWLQSFVTFGTLKGFGKLAEAQNLVFQHGVQDLATVAGHHLAFQAGLRENPEGTLAERLLQAEATTLQLAAGTSLGQEVTGGKLQALGRSLDLNFKSQPQISFSARTKELAYVKAPATGDLDSFQKDPPPNPSLIAMVGTKEDPPLPFRSRYMCASKGLTEVGSVEGTHFGPVEITLHIVSTPSPISTPFPTGLAHRLLSSFKTLLTGGEEATDLPRGPLSEEMQTNDKIGTLLGSLDPSKDPRMVVTMKADRTLLQLECYEGESLKAVFRDAAFLDFIEGEPPPPTERSPQVQKSDPKG